MGVAIRYLIPYELRFLAHDLATVKPISNRHYWRTYLNNAGPLPYGTMIPGGGDTTTVLTAVAAAWSAFVTARMSHNYVMDRIELRAIGGFMYSSPLSGIATIASAGGLTYFTTNTPHGFATGQSVLVSGVLTPPAANGVWINITVTSPTAFNVAPSLTLPYTYTGAGVVQKVSGVASWKYLEADTLVTTTPGGIAGDAVALFADASVLRLNTGIGKSFRSRFALAPIAESDVVDGKFTAGQQTAWAADLATLYTAWSNINNGGSDPGSKLMSQYAVSKKIALQQTPSFTDASQFTAGITSYRLHKYMGSQIKRKPKKLDA